MPNAPIIIALTPQSNCLNTDHPTVANCGIRCNSFDRSTLRHNAPRSTNGSNPKDFPNCPITRTEGPSLPGREDYPATARAFTAAIQLGVTCSRASTRPRCSLPPSGNVTLRWLLPLWRQRVGRDSEVAIPLVV